MKFLKWKYIFSLSLVLVNSSVYSLNYTDSINKIESNQEKLNLVEQLIFRSNENFTTGNLTKALVTSFDALKILENSNQYLQLYETYSILGNIYLVLNDYVESYHYINQAYHIAKNIKNSKETK